MTLLVTLVSPVSSARAVDYPSWQDLQNAKANTASAAAQVTAIENLIAGLQERVQETQASAEKSANELEVAQQDFDDATRRAEDIQLQADASKATADAATKQAGQLAAQLYRTGGTDLSVNLFLEGQGDGADADLLLAKLGNMSKLVERSSDVYDEAQSATNNAQSLGDQAKLAQAERETLRLAAETALAAAQAAAESAANALAESQAKSVELEQQLQFMRDAQATTTAGYEAGVAERARLEAIRVAAAAAAARAAAAAAAAAAASSGGSGGSVSMSGWGVPASGRITAGYGPRSVICNGGECSGSFHYATDLGTGCGAPIYAAHAGVVTWAGRLGTYGNFVKISHGDNVSTGYAHIRDGGFSVSVGQTVSAGQLIASSGDTGAANGCHLHFEVWIGGNRINPVPFMADRGASLG
ncbi:MAG: peptidoglycan DD-metalloendopeptidase family protein [Cryobacterium sp.]|uniref:peptidoglycan DD-metalloendopeptidase family protein n=1 Tax=Cryobacterium sp. TaxID=1926290 RepID=UPI002292277D|nr:M23 family metallopeptidase [Cryobacterium sp.]MCY7404863.1 peptidoglycan DD-metalloendopeptidase family protein [Cryobacterium sp.]